MSLRASMPTPDRTPACSSGVRPWPRACLQAHGTSPRPSFAPTSSSKRARRASAVRFGEHCYDLQRAMPPPVSLSLPHLFALHVAHRHNVCVLRGIAVMEPVPRGGDAGIKQRRACWVVGQTQSGRVHVADYRVAALVLQVYERLTLTSSTPTGWVHSARASSRTNRNTSELHVPSCID